jgi:hypothetical protein
MKYLAQFIAYSLFAAVVGLLSAWPKYQLLASDQAIVSLTFSHAGQRIGECRRLTQEELNELPPNMRKPDECPRERLPVSVEFRADGVVLYQQELQPSGLWADGKATVYQRLQVAAGAHELFIGMTDSGRDDDFDFELRVVRDLSPGQNLVIDFDELQQAFVLR